MLGLFLTFLALAVSITLLWFIAKQFYEIAKMKGHFETKYFWWCFLCGWIGYLMIIALPDRRDAEEPFQAEFNRAEEGEEPRQETEEKQRSEEKFQAEEAEKLARISAYWDNHSEELRALAEKRMYAKEKLKTLNSLSEAQRKALEDSIHAIDEELNKDREA